MKHSRHNVMLAFMVCHPKLSKVSQFDGNAENMQCAVMPQSRHPHHDAVPGSTACTMTK